MLGQFEWFDVIAAFNFVDSFVLCLDIGSNLHDCSRSKLFVVLISSTAVCQLGWLIAQDHQLSCNVEHLVTHDMKCT